MNDKGFTLVELLLVFSLIVLVGALTFPISISFFKGQVVDDTANVLTETLRKAHTEAVAQLHDSAFGVKVLSDSYVLFQGDSYAGRNASEDKIFTIPTTVTISNLDEVVFAQRTGLPSFLGSIGVTLGNTQKFIEINSLGIVE